MDDETKSALFEQALKVLHENDRGKYIVPAGELYPHQWLWDSCFIAIGLRHLDVDRAKIEIESLIRGQWANGMIPHLIFNPHPRHRREHNMWQGWLNPHAPNGVITSGITQPPLIAEAVVKVGQKMKLTERRSWYRQMYPHLLDYKKWLYQERATLEGLILILHPYESGMDNSPPLMHELREHAWPWWLKLLELSRLDRLINLIRRDIRHVPPGQRISNVEAIAEWALLRRLRSQAYDSKKILQRPRFALADVAFNSVLVRSNKHLISISKTIGEELPAELLGLMEQSEKALESLWDEHSGYYFGRCLTGESIHEVSIATFLPLYAGSISQERAEHLAKLLNKRSQFWPPYPVPSVPLNSPLFNPTKYWQGPTWVNMNWLIIEGLKQYGFEDEAESLRKKTIKLVSEGGCFEYFDPINGEPAGAPNFSWTAALTIDLLKH